MSVTSNAIATTFRATQFGETRESVTGADTSPWFLERVCQRNTQGRVLHRMEGVRTTTTPAAYQWRRYQYTYADLAGDHAGACGCQ